LARVILSGAKEPERGYGSFASLRMTRDAPAKTTYCNHLHFVALRLPAVTPFLLFPKLTTR